MLEQSLLHSMEANGLKAYVVGAIVNYDGSTMLDTEDKGINILDLVDFMLEYEDLKDTEFDYSIQDLLYKIPPSERFVDLDNKEVMISKIQGL